jgi:hypothetical protein
MLLKRAHEHGIEQITKLPLNDQSREILEWQLEAFRAKFGREPEANDPIFFDPSADEPRPLDLHEGLLKDEFLAAARKAGLPQPAIRYIEENFDRDAIFDCPQCEAQVIASAMSHPACPDCGHHPLHGGMITGK